MKNTQWIWIATIAFTLTITADAAKILALFAFPFKSHSHVYNAVMLGLLERGHELTIVGTYPLPSDAPKHTFLEISPQFDIIDMEHLAFTFLDLNQREILSLLFNYVAVPSTEHALKHPHVQNLIHNSTGLEFDLVIVEQFMQEAFLMFAHQFRAPLVSIAAFEFSHVFNNMFGVFGAWSHVSNLPYVVDEPLSLLHRIQNAFGCLVDNFEKDYMQTPKQQALADKYFTNLPEPRPSIYDLNRNISVLLMNGHMPLKAIRPTVPGLVDVGGVHIAPVKPLPDDLQAFLDASEHGAIYFSLGTGVHSSDVPEAQMQALLSTFRQFGNLSVLWTCDDDRMQSRVSPNVKVMQWMPQNDILAHPNIRFFITHGGMLGLSEAVHHGVPLIGIPIWFDQTLNIAKAAKAGYAIALRFDNLTETSLEWAFDEMLHNPTYAQQAKRTSAIYNDRPLKALDMAVYWVEYVIRHKGAGHLRSSAIDMNWMSYFMLDAIAVVAMTFVTSLLAVYVSVLLFCRRKSFGLRFRFTRSSCYFRLSRFALKFRGLFCRRIYDRWARYKSERPTTAP